MGKAREDLSDGEDPQECDVPGCSGNRGHRIVRFLDGPDAGVHIEHWCLYRGRIQRFVVIQGDVENDKVCDEHGSSPDRMSEIESMIQEDEEYYRDSRKHRYSRKRKPRAAIKEALGEEYESDVYEEEKELVTKSLDEPKTIDEELEEQEVLLKGLEAQEALLTSLEEHRPLREDWRNWKL